MQPAAQTATAPLRPESLAQVQDCLRWAAAEQVPIAVRGGGSLDAIGPPDRPATVLALDGLRGILSYDPAELTLTAHAGTSLAEINAALADHGQCLAFEPPDWGGLYGGTASSTLGGLLASNRSGSRRPFAGAARDHCLGVVAVSGRGERFKAGGHVVKNVTGYDLPKLLAGSWGTLAVIAEATVKVLPAAPAQATVTVDGLPDADAVALMIRIARRADTITGAAHLPATVLGLPRTVFRLEGPGESLPARRDALAADIARTAPCQFLPDAAALPLWAGLGGGHFLAEPADWPLWRVAVTPTAANDLVRTVATSLPGLRWYVDWAGGLLWLSLPPWEAADAGAAVIRGAVAALGGHATLMRADPGVRTRVPCLPPAAAAPLMARVKQQFDPHGILEPGRLPLPMPERAP